MMATHPLVEASGLHTYYGASHILHGVNITVHAGETLCLMGRNGMGKTTSLRSILGLTPPRKGKVVINGVDMTGAPPQKIARSGIAFVPETRGIFPTLNVLENLVMAERPERGDWNLTKVLDLFPRLAERLDNMGDQLSGGEQQMLTIGRALMTNPDLLILDEATEGLAPLIRKEIWKVVRIIKDHGIASIVVDKDVNRLLPISDRALIIQKGKIVHESPAADLIANPDIHIKYLGI